ncbi:MAG: ABC transporter ATP-binding protein [Clostridia bacterium]|nr:ABC transporter ATP-binding protein [Clostridia bacterium]
MDNFKNKLPDYEELFESIKDEKKLGFRIICSIFNQNKKDFILSIILHFAKNIAVWVIPIVLAGAINIATDKISGKPSDVIDIWRWALLGLIVLVLNLPFNAMFVHYSSRALRNIGAGMRNSLIKKLQHLSITYHKEMESGKLQSKFLRDVESIEFLNRQIIMSMVPCIITAVVSFVIVIFKNPFMALLFLMIVPINVCVMRFFRKKIIKINREFRHQVENVSSQVSDMIEMIPVTKAHGLEEEEIHKLSGSLLNLKNTGLSLDKVSGYFTSINWILNNIFINLFVIVAAVLAFNGHIRVGDIAMYQIYFNLVLHNINAIITLYQEISRGMESLKSVTEVMASDDIEDNRNKLKVKEVTGKVRFNNVTFAYSGTEKPAVKNLSFEINKGECMAFVGASGCGKTTVMNMIIGFLKPVEGNIQIDDRDINSINLESYRKHIAVVPQNSILFTGTIRENILYGMKDVSEKDFQKVLEKANIIEFLDKLPNGIDTSIGEHGGKLSGGQKQRICIARALIRDPKIIILDEATSALDNISEYQVQKAMNSLIKDRTTFIVAHRLSTIRNANRIIVMKNGEMVETGTYQELMDKEGEFYKLKNLSQYNMESEQLYDL